MSRKAGWRLVALGITAGVGGCAIIQPDRLPAETDHTVRRPPSGAGCGDWALGNAVAGELDISIRGGRAETSLVAPNGQRLRVIWPDGFSVTATTPPVLNDDRGTALYTDGEAVELSQVEQGQFEGTPSDPVVASGLFGGGCWVITPTR